MRFPGFGPFESYTPEQTVKRRRQAARSPGFEIDVIGTPGHSPDHVTYSIAAEKAIFSGDVLFQGSVGRTDLPGCDHADADGLASPTLLDTLPGRHRRAPGPHGADDARRRAREQPVPARARRPVSRRSRRRAARTTCCPSSRTSATGSRATAAKILERAGYGRIETPTFEATQLFSRTAWARRPTSSRRRCTRFEDGSGDSLHAAPRGHRAGRARLPRARHAQGAAAGEAAGTSRASSATRRPQAGRFRQFWQIGAEAIGSRRPGRRRRADPAARRAAGGDRRARRQARDRHARPARARAPPTARSCRPTCGRTRTSSAERSSTGSTSTRCAPSTPSTSRRSA